MATLTRGFTYASNGEVTNTNLHQLVDDGTVTNIAQADFANNVGTVLRQTSQPTDTDAVWVDTDDDYKVKVYNATDSRFQGVYFEDHLNVVVSKASVSTIAVTADRLNAEGMRLKTVNVTANITTAGANGLDTGTEAANTWYAIWVIVKVDGTVASLLSTSATAPTMPTDYVFKRLVGWVFNNATPDFAMTSSILDSFADRGDPTASDWTEATLTTDGTWRDLNLRTAGLCPPGAKSVLLRTAIADDAIDSVLQFRQKGNSNEFNISSSVTQVANQTNQQDLVVAVDTNGEIQYNADNLTWASITIRARGVWF